MAHAKGGHVPKTTRRTRERLQAAGGNQPLAGFFRRSPGPLSLTRSSPVPAPDRRPFRPPGAPFLKLITMKATLLLPILLAGVSLAVLSGCSSAGAARTASHHANSVGLPLTETPASLDPAGWTLQLHPGNTRDAVLTQLGLPQAAIGEDIWIYGHVQSPDREMRALGYDTLVVAFAEDRISRLRLVNGREVQALLARHAGDNPAVRTVVAAKE